MSVNDPPAVSRTAPVLLWAAMLLGAALLGAAVTAALLRQTPPAGPDTPVEAGRFPGADEPLGVAWLRSALAGVGAPERAQLLGDPARFRAFVEQEIARRRLLVAARTDGLADDPRVAWLAGRAGEQVVVNAFVNARIVAAVGPGFPDDERVREFYEANRERYALPERVAVSQIYLAGPQGSASRQRAVREAQAILAGIRDGSVSFELAAAEHSGHAASATNGGFMGLVKVVDLRPELREAVLALAPGEVSEPLVGVEGVHLVRRGPTLPAQVPALDAVRERVVADLKRVASTELRRKLATSALEASTERPETQEIERWRAALLASEPSGSGAEPASQSSQVSSQTPIK